MAINAILTPDDLKRGDLLTPGWKTATIIKYREEVTKGNDKKPSDGSMNAIFEFKLDEGPTVTRYLNEKALGFGKNLYAAVGLPKNASGGYDLSTEQFEKFVGAKLEVYIKRGVSDKGKEFNELEDFRALRA